MLASRAVERAYREAAIKPIGSVLTDAEYEEGLDRLNGFLASLFSGEIGQLLADWQVPIVLRTAPMAADNLALPFPQNLTTLDQPYAPTEYPVTSRELYPPANVRVLWGGQEETTIYLPEFPHDGARVEFVNVNSAASLTVLGNGRRIDGGTSLVFASDAVPVLLFYRADLGSWFPIAHLTLTDESPLPAEFDDLLVAGTAIRLTALDEISPQSGTMFIYDRLLKRCSQRYRQPANQPYDSLAMTPSMQPYDGRGQDGRLW
jgi:hypothetical protein